MTKLKHSIWICNKQEECGRAGKDCEHAVPHKINIRDRCHSEEYDCTWIQDTPQEDLWPDPVWCICVKVDYEKATT